MKGKNGIFSTSLLIAIEYKKYKMPTENEAPMIPIINPSIKNGPLIKRFVLQVKNNTSR